MKYIIFILLILALFTLGCTKEEVEKPEPINQGVIDYSPKTFEIDHPVVVEETKDEPKEEVQLKTTNCIEESTVQSAPYCLIIYNNRVYNLDDTKPMEFQVGSYGCNAEHDIGSLKKWFNTSRPDDKLELYYLMDVC